MFLRWVIVLECGDHPPAFGRLQGGRAAVTSRSRDGRQVGAAPAQALHATKFSTRAEISWRALPQPWRPVGAGPTATWSRGRFPCPIFCI